MVELRSIILAAGKGTRMKSDVPKVLQLICGYPIIHYPLVLTKAVRSLKNYIVLGHKGEAVQKYLSANYKISMDFIEQKQQNGTAHAVKCVVPKLKSFRGDVLILCGDTPLLETSTIKELIRKHRISKASVTFLTAVVREPFGYGRIIRDGHGRAAAIREEKDAQGIEKNIAEINVGVYCFKAQDLIEGLKKIKVNKLKGEYYLTDIIENFYGSGWKIETVESDNVQEGLGVNTFVDLSVAEKVHRQKILRQHMLNGVKILDPQTTFIDHNVSFGKDCVIYPYTFIHEDVKIGNNCVIGPFARIRPATRLGDRVEVGNFTEISRTKVGDECFVKHFSFLGDAAIGKQVNVGAGTITANFDGKEKHKTRVGDGVFIGSDTVLIAPVTIGKKAKIGAGSVVTSRKKIPEHAVAMGVPAKVVERGKGK
ncbi:MAG: bifunctional N-acetylglucosamine-1-phosphate uridyltransferase/glucosamine-1-phosphate acetyltransferase [Candidatus Omnitrophica bacterium]|nr:bifunctional N-acetylglucosamine-1-phosphate uridyltransferase/glucosamine-1-phosphate acetyltransferase [Candidatus Omnitrophota bacterium]